MAAAEKLYAGKIPEIYDRFLVPLIFESYARDLAERVAKVKPSDVLETAAGTGALTFAIASTIRTVPALLSRSKAWANYCDWERPLEQAIKRLGRSRLAT